MRYAYGEQTLITRLEILHSWYSNLIGYLPEVYGKSDEKIKEYIETYSKLFIELSVEIDAAFELYDGGFEGQSCNPTEKKLLKAMRGIKERLDVITAKSKVIDKIQPEDEVFEV